MKIKEAEEKTGLTRKAIRYYESNGLIHPAQPEENGYKDYDEETIRSLLLIRKLRLLDFSVPQIRQYLSGDDPSRLLKKRIQEEQQTLSKAKQTIRLLEKIKRGENLETLDVEALLLSDALTETRRILSGNLIFAMANLGSFLVITALLILQMMRHPSFTLPPYLLMIQCSLTAILGIWKSRLKKKALERGVFLRMVMPAEAALLFLLCAFTFAVAGQMILSRIWLIRAAVLQPGGGPAVAAAVALQGLCLLLYAALDLVMVILPFTSAMRSRAEFTTWRQPTDLQPRRQGTPGH